MYSILKLSIFGGQETGPIVCVNNIKSGRICEQRLQYIYVLLRMVRVLLGTGTKKTLDFIVPRFARPSSSVRVHS